MNNIKKWKHKHKHILTVGVKCALVEKLLKLFSLESFFRDGPRIFYKRDPNLSSKLNPRFATLVFLVIFNTSKIEIFIWTHTHLVVKKPCFSSLGPLSLRESYPIWASEESLVAHSRVLERLASLSQIWELAGRLRPSGPLPYWSATFFCFWKLQQPSFTSIEFKGIWS